MTPKHYILDENNNPVVEEDFETWAKWNFGSGAAVRVDYTEINSEVFVSTVFLGLDHNLRGEGPPILFETMVFGGECKLQLRYTTWEEAQEGHKEIVANLRERYLTKHRP